MATSLKNLSEFDADKLPDATNLKIGLVVSEWNGNITENLSTGAKEALIEVGVKESNIVRWNVPGSFELPAGCRKMLTSGEFDAIVAIGSVIRGETSHFDFVCSATAQGIMELNVSQDVPIIFCVLTDDTLAQAEARSGGVHGNKGVEAAIAAIKMAGLGA